MAKKVVKNDVVPVKCNCRDCKRAGPVEDFMCYCPIVGCKRSTGIRMCLHFKPK